MRKLKTSRPLIIGVIIIVILGGFGIIRSIVLGQRGAGNSNITWATGVAAVGPITVTVSGTGALQPGSTADIRTQVAGTVRRVLVASGSVVREGTPLVDLDNESTLLAWEQARLTFEAESEALAELLAGSASDSTAIRAAELRVDQARLALESRQEAVDKLTVKAPSAGRVLTVDAGTGDVLPAGGLILSMVEGPTAQVTLQVAEADVGRIQVGDRAAVLFGPLPQVHTITIQAYEQALYGLRVGDAVIATIDGQWAGTVSPIVRGQVVAITAGGTMFQVKCRLPGLTDLIPAGANVSYMQIFPSGKQAGGVPLTASGKLAIEVDTWGLDDQQAAGQGTAALVHSVAAQAAKTATGQAVYAVNLRVANYPATARAGMSVHGYISPAAGAAISGVAALELPTTRMIASAGGKVTGVLVRPGDTVVAGQLLATVDNASLTYQLEDARNALALAEESLAKISGSTDLNRQVRLQEIRTRQAELTLEARLSDVQALQITAPQDGVVAGLNEALTVGKTVTAGTSVCRVLNYDSMQLTIQIDELEVAWVTPGLEANVSVDALPGKSFPAKVVDVAQEGTYQQGVSKFTIRLQVASSPQLRAQMTSTATIRVAEKAEALLVPAEAVAFLGDGFGSVNVVGADGKVKETRITIGLYNDTHVEVLDGIAAGAVVITGVAPDGGRTLPGGLRLR